METQVQNTLNEIMAEFSAWVKELGRRAPEMKTDSDVLQVEELRERGQAILLKLMQQTMQSASDRGGRSSRSSEAAIAIPAISTSRRLPYSSYFPSQTSSVLRVERGCGVRVLTSRTYDTRELAAAIEPHLGR